VGAIIATAEHLPVPDKSFETVLALEILEHTDQPATVLSELRRVAKRRIIISVPIRIDIPQHNWILSVKEWDKMIGARHSIVFRKFNNAGWVINLGA